MFFNALFFCQGGARAHLALIYYSFYFIIIIILSQGGARAHWALISGLAIPPRCVAAQMALLDAFAGKEKKGNAGDGGEGRCGTERGNIEAGGGEGWEGGGGGQHSEGGGGGRGIGDGDYPQRGGGGGEGEGGEGGEHVHRALRNETLATAASHVSLQWCRRGGNTNECGCTCSWCQGAYLGLSRLHAEKAEEQGDQGAKGESDGLYKRTQSISEDSPAVKGEWEGLLALCSHGKSRRQAVWGLENLLASCSKLHQARDDVRAETRGPMVVPDTLEGLRGKLIVLSL
jgi:hypothetical protein